MRPEDAKPTRGRRPTPAIGDGVRVATDARNEFLRYEHSPGTEGARRPIDGMVVAIREISSGQPVIVAAGDARRYVFDLLDDQSFDPRVSSKRNSQGVSAGRVRDAEAYHQVKQALRQLAGRAAPASGYSALAGPPLSELLDGWRVIRVRTPQVDVMETEES